MDLKTFVSETLTQIVEGVQDAQKRIADGESGAAVNPTSVGADSKQNHAAPQPVEFDVAVIASDEAARAKGEQLSASIGIISVLTARTAGSLDNKETGTQRNEVANRIKFTVMLAQPAAISKQPRYDPARGIMTPFA